jgi:UDP-N-acetylmuramoyl-tripeptide--D-alanyl-D-alanine ligase
VLEVADSEKSLLELAAWSRKRSAGTLVITVQTTGRPRLGRWIAGVLRTRLSGTRRLTVTAPAQLAAAVFNWSQDTELGIAEVNAASADTVAQATRLACPQIAVISAMGESINNEIAKWEPVKEGLAALTAAIPPEGWLVTDGDEPELDELACLRRCHLMRVGRDPSCDVAATNVCCDAGRTTFQIRGMQYSFAGDPRQDLAAVLAALGVARIAGFSAAEIARGLATVNATGRMSGHAA